MTGLGGGRDSYAVCLEPGSGGGLERGAGGNPTRNQKLQTGVPGSESCMHSLRQKTLHQKDMKEPKHSKCHM